MSKFLSSIYLYFAFQLTLWPLVHILLIINGLFSPFSIYDEMVASAASTTGYAITCFIASALAMFVPYFFKYLFVPICSNTM